MSAVTGVENRGPFQAFRQIGRDADGPVADDDGIGSHGLERPCRVAERLSLADARTGGRPVDDIGAEHFFGQFEGDARPRRGLEEEVDDQFPPKGGNFLDRAIHEGLHVDGLIEKVGDFLTSPDIEIDEIAAFPAKHRHSPPVRR